MIALTPLEITKTVLGVAEVKDLERKPKNKKY